MNQLRRYLRAHRLDRPRASRRRSPWAHLRPRSNKRSSGQIGLNQLHWHATPAQPNAQKGVLCAKISQARCPSGAQLIERNGIPHVSVQTMIDIQKYRLPL
jgi:hypothetical protein